MIILNNHNQNTYKEKKTIIRIYYIQTMKYDIKIIITLTKQQNTRENRP